MSPWSVGDLLNSTNLNTKMGGVKWFNVQEYGAKGDNSTDDTAAINAAITAAEEGAVIYFPHSDAAGTFDIYKISSTLTVTKPLRFVGTFGSVGGSGSGPWISGTINGPLINFNTTGTRQGSGVFDLGLQNLSAGASSSLIDAQNIGAPACFHRIYGDAHGSGIRLLSNTFSVSVRDCDIEGQNTANSVGVYAAGHTNVDTVSCVGFHSGFRVSGGFSSFVNCRAEVNQNGYEIGVDQNGSDFIAQGVTFAGGSGEANDTQVLVTHADSLVMTGMRFHCTTNAPSGAGIYGVKVDICSNSLFAGLTIDGSSCANGGVQLNAGPNRAFIVFNGVKSSTATPWTVDIAGGVTGVDFIGCNTDRIVQTLTNTGATPTIAQTTVGGPALYRFNYGGDTTITDLVGGVAGVPTVIQSMNAASHITLQHGTNIFLSDGLDRKLAPQETVALMKFVSTTSRWDEIGGNKPLSDGSSTSPGLMFRSETSLGFYRSAASTIALSRGTFNLNGGILSSIRSTNASATSATLNDGEFRIAAVSTTSAELAYRSGNTTYRFIAAATAL